MDDDLNDTHLCIKCSQTIVGLDNYIQHRKQNCSLPRTTAHDQTKLTTSTTSPTQHHQTEVTPSITYEPFQFTEPEPPTSSSHGGKTSKSLGESYELPYELEADVFFSSLQLQSVQSTVGQHVPSSSGGKTGSAQTTHAFSRQKSLPQENENAGQVEETWINTTSPEATHTGGGEPFLKTVSDISDKKSYDTVFKPLTYEHDSPEVSEDEDEDEMEVDMDDDDEDYDPMAEGHGSGGKWKPPQMRHSPPVVPVSHTGGKWKPENRPDLRVAHSQLSRVSPTWDDNLEELDTPEGQHPPSDHTKGKWVPGTKLQRLEYKEVVELAKCSNTNQDYWCNICCRKLKSKLIYENHLKTSYHLKRAEPEMQLEKAVIEELPREHINKSFSTVEFKPLSITFSPNTKRRKRRCTYLKCNVCKHVMTRHLIGKHLISHYHYRRMQLRSDNSLHMILDNIHAIVLQSPFQCRPCRFYANTEEAFLLHWNSATHLDTSEGPGRFWCSYCQFECEDNNQMRRHLLGPEHKEVILAINRSVPICISKRITIDCAKCGAEFRFNFELKRHFVSHHANQELVGTISDAYQSKFKCASCPEVLPSQIALQRHEKFKHFVTKYYCSICCMEFNSACQARRHRKTLVHKKKAAEANKKIVKEELQETFDLKREKSPINTSNETLQDDSLREEKPCTSAQAKEQALQNAANNSTQSMISDETKLNHPKDNSSNQHSCILCSQTFKSAQELGRHSRNCQPNTKASAEDFKNTPPFKKTINQQGEKVWQCDLCEFRSNFKSEIHFHRVFHSYGSVGKNQLLSCPLCEKSFRKQSLRFHLHNHLNEKLYKCDSCNTSFSRPNNLKDHIRNLHGNTNKNPKEKEKDDLNSKDSGNTGKIFSCDFCDKVFKSKHFLKMHCLTHHPQGDTAAAEKPQLFKCSQENCEYSSVSKSLLMIHLNSHSAESFKCPEKDCNYVGKSKLHLKRHRQSHTPLSDAKLFTCEQCTFKTKIKGHLQRHTRQHTGEKPYPCPHCDFRSTTWENLRKHVLKTDKHAGKYVFECKMCAEVLNSEAKVEENVKNEIFKTNSHQEYQQHLKNVHQQLK